MQNSVINMQPDLDKQRDDKCIPIAREVLKDISEPLYIVKRSGTEGNFGVYCMQDPESFVCRKDLPESWAGKTDEKLAEITGVKDSVFCHTKRFMCVAKSKEGAIELAKIAINS